jgi:hypothetical protein
MQAPEHSVVSPLCYQLPDEATTGTAVEVTRKDAEGCVLLELQFFLVTLDSRYQYS